MSATETIPKKKITVTAHAIEQYRARLGERMPIRQAEEIIEAEVRCAERAGHVLNHKPDGFLMYGEKRAQLPTGQRFVYCEEKPRVGFVVKRFPQETVVVTTLVRVGVRK